MQFRRTVSGRVLGLKRQPGWTHDTYLIGNDGSTPDTVLWGDSFAQALVPGFITFYSKTGQGAVIAAAPGCPPLLGVTFYRRLANEKCHFTTMLFSKPSVSLVFGVSFLWRDGRHS